MLNQPEIREQFPGTKDMIYANTSSCGLVSRDGVKIMNSFMQSLHEGGSMGSEYFLSNQLPEARKAISKFMDADLDEIALIPNFSFGLNALLPVLTEYRKVLLLEDDYPSLTQPFVLNDFDITWLKSEDGFYFDLNQIREIIRKKQIKIVAISQVQYLTGFLMDIESLGRICKENGALLIVDGTQSLGAIPYSFRDSLVDIMITSNYKWMNAGFGTGIMAIKKGFIEAHEPKIGGFASFIQKDGSWGYQPSITSYEPGHLNFGGILVLEDAVNLKMALGIDGIHQHIQALLDILASELKALNIELVGPYTNENRLGILCIKETPIISEAMKKHNILFKTRNGNIRLGIHFHNEEDDVYKIVEAIREVI